MEFDGELYCYVYNQQGDVVGILDSAGKTVVNYYYDAWGNPTGSIENNVIASLNPFRYRGYIGDAETDLYYMRNRYYAPHVSRFINIDIFAAKRSTYCYCENNPIILYDADGNAWKWLEGLVAGIAIVGGVALCALGGPVGAAVGTPLISAGIDLFDQTQLKGRSFSEVEWEDVGAAAVSGLISVAIPGATIGKEIVRGVLSTAVETAFNIAAGDTQIENMDDIEEIAYNLSVGVLLEVTSGEMKQALDKWVGKTISVDIKPSDIREAAKQAGKSMTRTASKIEAKITKRRNGYIIQFISGAEEVAFGIFDRALSS